MARLTLGDIFELETSKGKAYLHFIHKEHNIGELIRVLDGLYPERPSCFEELAGAAEQFMIYFPLAAAKRRKIVARVGNFPAKAFAIPRYMRTTHYVRGEFLGWHIVNTGSWKTTLVKELSPEEKQLSPWGTWNDTLLIERLEQNWSLENWS